MSTRIRIVYPMEKRRKAVRTSDRHRVDTAQKNRFVVVVVVDVVVVVAAAAATATASTTSATTTVTALGVA
jgi:hypothetical protein